MKEGYSCSNCSTGKESCVLGFLLRLFLLGLDRENCVLGWQWTKEVALLGSLLRFFLLGLYRWDVVVVKLSKGTC